MKRLYLSRLKQVLHPPLVPFNTGSDEEWNTLEQRLGVRLPTDFKEFIKVYGTGGIDDFVWILTPFVQDESVNIVKRINVLTESYLKSKKQFPQYYRHNVFPQKGGLFPWAFTDNGDEIYWLTDGDTNNWSIIVYETRSPDYHQYDMSMTEFLYKLVTKELTCAAFPADFPQNKSQFISINVK